MAWGLEDKTVPERVAAAINGGTDTLSGFATNKTVKDLLDGGLISKDRVTEAAGRLLKEQFQLGLFDTRWALILTYPTFLIPFSTWLLMGYFRSIPFELEECALIDGATRFEILVKIILPLSVPGLISAGIFAFTLSWNEFIYALTFISSSEVKTVPVGVVTELVEGDVYHWGSLMAGALLGSLPVAVMYSFFVEHYVSGMTGAVKE